MTNHTVIHSARHLTKQNKQTKKKKNKKRTDQRLVVSHLSHILYYLKALQCHKFCHFHYCIIKYYEVVVLKLFHVKDPQIHSLACGPR